MVGAPFEWGCECEHVNEGTTRSQRPGLQNFIETGWRLRVRAGRGDEQQITSARLRFLDHDPIDLPTIPESSRTK
jgi:hypothetical protein